MNDLPDLLHDAVADIEPDRPARRDPEPVRRARRAPAGRGCYAAGATVLATAADRRGVRGDRQRRRLRAGPVRPRPGPTPSTLVAAYFVGDTPSGPRLLPRVRRRCRPDDAAGRAGARSQQRPSDPDYSTPWDRGLLQSATRRRRRHHGRAAATSDRLRSTRSAASSRSSTRSRPPPETGCRCGSSRTAERVGMGPIDAPATDDVLSLVSISDPAEGNEYADSLDRPRPRQLAARGPCPGSSRRRRRRCVRRGSLRRAADGPPRPVGGRRST